MVRVSPQTSSAVADPGILGNSREGRVSSWEPPACARSVVRPSPHQTFESGPPDLAFLFISALERKLMGTTLFLRGSWRELVSREGIMHYVRTCIIYLEFNFFLIHIQYISDLLVMKNTSLYFCFLPQLRIYSVSLARVPRCCCKCDIILGRLFTVPRQLNLKGKREFAGAKLRC